MKHALILILLLPVLLFIGTIALIIFTTQPECNAPGMPVDPSKIPSTAVSGYSGEQLKNAAIIINTGAHLGINTQGQTIAVMTAMGESGLRILDHGDKEGPDSRGLFQQRESRGPLHDRMDPTRSATLFYQRLTKIKQWESLAPTIAAHRVQINANPYHYEKYWTHANAVMQALGATQQHCQENGPPGQVNAHGWASPAAGKISSHFGNREPICLNGACSRSFHNATDIQGPCGAPIYAAHIGRVVFSGPNGSYGNWILIDHGNGISTGYAHMFADGLLVRTGQNVVAGQNIAKIGRDGIATGCHLHFEVRQNGKQIDPERFMTSVGITLG